jgi:hypothetical protein
MFEVVVTAILVLVIGSIIAVSWWAIADKVFPSSRRSRNQAGSAGPKPTVVRGFASPSDPPGEEASGEGSSSESAR